MEHSGHRQRLRQRFEANQLNGFSDHEILELLLTYAIPRMDVNPLAHRLVARFGSLSGVLEASMEELKTVEGMGDRSAALLSMMVPLFRCYDQNRLQPHRKITTFSSLAFYAVTLFVGLQEEHFFLLCFDAKMQITKVIELARGTADAVHVSPKLIVQQALRNNAVSVAIAHNHPSGDPQPSAADMMLTRAVHSALEMVEIKLVDHVIVGGHESYSIVRNSPQDSPYARAEYLAAEDGEFKRKRCTEKRIRPEEDEFL